jgi:hypothetical protein
MRAKFGINLTGNEGEFRNVWCKVGGASARHRKFSDSQGMNCGLSVELPKLDVTGSIPVARSIILLNN